MAQEIFEVVPHRHSLTTRALRLATFRIGLVSLGAGGYFLLCQFHLDREGRDWAIAAVH